MPLKAVAFDWGHTVMDECRDGDVPLDVRPVHLMPGVSEVLPQIPLPLALWANTRVAAEADVRGWLERAGLGALFRWVITSVDAGARKPAPQFFQYALARCGLAREEVLFVGNQLNTDVSGAEAFGIPTAWLSGPDYRSADDAPCNASPTYTIRTLNDLPALLRHFTNHEPHVADSPTRHPAASPRGRWRASSLLRIDTAPGMPPLRPPNIIQAPVPPAPPPIARATRRELHRHPQTWL